ncbi:MAG: PstS family phosphate ABC transporter substrate-binding protein [Fimbriimonadales bacterium]
MRSLLFSTVLVSATLFALAGCTKSGETEAGGPSGSALSGQVVADGSSTVFPITEAVAEEFQKLNPGVKVTVGISGTGGGFKKFIASETDIQNASRPIKESEDEAAATAGIEYVELPVAFDGLSIIVNPQNTWATSLTVAELKKIWEPGSKVNNWSQVRPGFPNRPIKLYGAGTDSGTFDYFTEAICGKEGASRPDYQASEDDNTLVTGVAGDPSALGYFGFAYYSENKDKLKLVGIDNGNGPVLPSEETINSGTYAPLARPIFIYVAMKSAERPEVRAFVEFYLSVAGRKLVGEVGYVPLPDAAYELAIKRFQEGKAGSLFSGGSQIGVKIEDLLKR